MCNKIRKSGILPMLFGLMTTFFLACSEEERSALWDKNAPTPAAIDVKTVQVENYAGKSVLRYQVPKDVNLLSVKAVYETAPGVVRETIASRYVDSLVLEGYGRGGDYTVQLYSIGTNGKESAAVNKTVSPLASPIYAAFETLDVQGMFGGVLGTLENPDKVLITAVLTADTAHVGKQIFLRSFVLGTAKPSFNYLGLRDVETEFSVYLKDRWGNRTDTKTFTCTPIFEEEIDKGAPWLRYTLPSDRYESVEGERYIFENIWDKKNASWNYYYISNIKPLPCSLTINLNQRVTLSRLVFYHGFDWACIPQYTPKNFELWLSDVDTPGNDFYGGDWQLIARLEGTLFSNDPTQDEENRARWEGETFYILPTDEIPNPYIEGKYLRIRFLTVGDEDITETGIRIGEIDLFGKIIK